jgi:hypothetical protein
MNQELNRFFNRIQNRNFSFTTDKFDEEYLIKLEKKLQKEINKNLLKNPDTTCNWLKSIYYQIEEGQEYIHKTYMIDIQNRINDKSTKTIITKEEDENFQGANIILNALDLFKNLIIQNIKLVKPEIIKSKNTKAGNTSLLTKPEEAAEKTDLPRKDIVKIKPEILQEVYESLKEYFDAEDYLLLLELFEGKEITKKLVFKHKYKNPLIELFKRIKYNDYFVILLDNTTIAAWICDNFKTELGEFKYKTVYKDGLCGTKLSLTVGKRICKSIDYLTKNALKQKRKDNEK